MTHPADPSEPPDASEPALRPLVRVLLLLLGAFLVLGGIFSIARDQIAGARASIFLGALFLAAAVSGRDFTARLRARPAVPVPLFALPYTPETQPMLGLWIGFALGCVYGAFLQSWMYVVASVAGGIILGFSRPLFRWRFAGGLVIWTAAFGIMLGHGWHRPRGLFAPAVMAFVFAAVYTALMWGREGLFSSRRAMESPG